MSQVTFKNLSKFIGSINIIDGLNLEIHDSEFLVLLGPSGCGKSTTLRLLAGLETVSSGTISIDGCDVTALEPRERDIAMVFQNYALYPTMTVAQNIGFGLKAKKIPSKMIKEKVNEIADLLGLTHLLSRKPDALSGGQQQRVAIGRAIVRKPKVFLFDEPLSNLDANLRLEMRAEIMKLHRELGATTIFVTHDQEEAMAMADRIVIMDNGLIEQVGTPTEIYFRPKTRKVASFIGNPSMNFIEGKISKNLEINTTIGNIKLHTHLNPGEDVEVGIRPEKIKLVDSKRKANEIKVRVLVTYVELLGPRAVVKMKHEYGQQFTSVVDHDEIDKYKVGTQISISLDNQALHIFPRIKE